MTRVSGWLWIGLAGAVLQVVSLGTNFYLTTADDGTETARDAWFGIAHASELLLAVALVTVVLTILMAVGRSPMSGRKVGLTIGVLGTISSLHLVYRMVAPPFDFTIDSSMTMADLFNGCLGYCAPSQAGNAELLPGIFIALGGCVAVAIGGYLHAASKRAKMTEPNFWRAEKQAGMTPWLTVAGAGALGQFIFGYTFFTFYVTNSPDGSTSWAGWFPTPHTAVMVLWSTVLVVSLVVMAARNRAPMMPATLGGVIAVFGFFAASRIGYRMAEAPFGGGGGAVPVELGIGAFLSIASAVLVVVAGIAQATTHREAMPIQARADASAGAV